MRSGAVAALALCMIGTASAAELEVRSSIDTVTVYPDGATVTRVVKVRLPAGDTMLVARDFPPSLDPASLRIEGVGNQHVVIGSIDAHIPGPEEPPANPKLEERLQALRDQHSALQDAIEAASLRRSFVERFANGVPLGLGEKGEARPLAEWRQAFAAVSEELAAADAVLRETRRKQREVEREIAQLENRLRGDPARKMEVRIDLASGQQGEAMFRVSYAVRDARWAAQYDARLESGAREGKPSLELVRRATIVQETGEDWDNVALSVSTVRTRTGGRAPDLRPLVVRLRQDRAKDSVASDRASFARPAPAAPVMLEAVAAERESVMEVGGFQVVFRIPGRVTVPSHGAGKSFRISTTTVEPELTVRSAPALDATAFLEAAFRHADEAPLLPGRVSLYRDGTFVGGTSMPATVKDDEVRLGFGVDEMVKVARLPVRRTEGAAGLISSSRTDEREFKITVRSGHVHPVRIRIEDQLPVSETEDVVVEMLPLTTPPSHRNAGDRRGILAWEFESKPGEAREIRLGWRVRWPSDKAIVYGTSAHGTSLVR